MIPTKKQLAALAYGRAVRKANLKKQKTTNASYRRKGCKTLKRKTKASFDEILDELEEGGGESAEINVDGNLVDIPIPPPEEKPSFWQKAKKFVIGAAGAAALGGLGLYGLSKAGVVDWNSLKGKLSGLGASAQQIAGVKAALKEDTEEERQKKIAEREQTMNKSEGKDWSNFMPHYWINNGWRDLVEIRKGTDSMEWAESKKGPNRYQKKLYDIIIKLKANPLDLDLNALTNALNDIERDVRSFNKNHTFGASHTKEYLVDMHKFPQEYNEMLTTKSKNIFKHWIYKKIDILTYIYQNYTKLLEEGTRK